MPSTGSEYRRAQWGLSLLLLPLCARLPGLVENENAHVRSGVSVIRILHRTIGSWLPGGTAGRLVQQRRHSVTSSCFFCSGSGRGHALGRRKVELVLRSGLLGVLKYSMPIPRCHLQHEEHNRRS